MKAYNKVFLPDYERFMEQAAMKVRAQVKNVDKMRSGYVKEVRGRHLRYMEVIPFIRDGGYQYRD